MVVSPSLPLTSPQSDRRVLEGSKVLEKLERLETFNERPIKQTIISDCGVLQPLEVLSME